MSIKNTTTPLYFDNHFHISNNKDEDLLSPSNLDLVPFNATVPLGGSFNDTLPGWGSGKFVSASIALVLESRLANWSATPGFENTFYYNGTRQVLASDSLEDVSSAVSGDGHLDLNFPSSDTGIEFRLFAFYQKRSGYREQVSPEKIVQIPQSKSAILAHI